MPRFGVINVLMPGMIADVWKMPTPPTHNQHLNTYPKTANEWYLGQIWSHISLQSTDQLIVAVNQQSLTSFLSCRVQFYLTHPGLVTVRPAETRNHLNRTFAASGRLDVIDGTTTTVYSLKFKSTWDIQHDNDPKHTSKSASEWTQKMKRRFWSGRIKGWT